MILGPKRARPRHGALPNGDTAEQHGVVQDVGTLSESDAHILFFVGWDKCDAAPKDDFILDKDEVVLDAVEEVHVHAFADVGAEEAKLET